MLAGIEGHPNRFELLNSLLWSYLNQGKTLSIKSIMNYLYTNDLFNMPKNWQSFAEGFDVLNQFYTALSIYQQHISQKTKNYQEIIDYSDVLKRAKLYEEAYRVERLLWNRFLAKGTKLNHEALQALAQIAPFFVSGSTQVQILNEVIIKQKSKEDINILLNWMVPRVDEFYGYLVLIKSLYLSNTLPDLGRKSTLRYTKMTKLPYKK